MKEEEKKTGMRRSGQPIHFKRVPSTNLPIHKEIRKDFFLFTGCLRTPSTKFKNKQGA